jgi:hypothetical protein
VSVGEFPWPRFKLRCIEKATKLKIIFLNTPKQQNLKLALPMTPGTLLYLLNRWYHWSILNTIHAVYITHLIRE